MRCAAHILLATATLGTPAHATLDAQVTTAYTGLCQMTQTCTANGACGTTPSVGTLLLVTTENGTSMGQTEASLAPVDHYPTLDAALPLPHLDTRRRTFLTDLPPQGTARRFAVRVQTLRPETGDPILRGQYFVLSCEAL